MLRLFRSLAPALLLLACPGWSQEARRPEGSDVRLYYDDLHVPHVFAETDEGVFRGLGYSQVRDFPVATLINLWCATGRFAEVAGELALPRDERMRQWGFDLRAAELANDPTELDPLARSWLRAYVDGVNAGRREWLAHPEWIDALVGPERELGFHPVPSWLHPQRTKDDPRARLARLFEAEIGLEHVLAYGLTLAAGPDFGGAGYSTFTNVFLMRGSERDPDTRFFADVHQPLQDFGYRSYLAQLAGPTYDMVGNTVPGFPCLVLGANRRFAFGSMTPPKTPRKLASAGVPFRLGNDSPLAKSAWSARLEPSEPARFRRGDETIVLRERVVTLRYWSLAENALVDDPNGPLTLRWVPDGDGLELPVTEPGPRESLDPATAPTVRFEARTFLGQRSLWETWMSLGVCRGVGDGEGGAQRVLERECLATGRGQTVLACDTDGGFAFSWSTRTPRLGKEALARWKAGGAATLFDGRDPALRWLGFHPFAELPKLVESRPRGEHPVAWLGCNGSPQFLGPELADLSFAGPPTIWDGEPWQTRRLPRARELFARAAADGRLETSELEALALDVQDGWSRDAWPWVRAFALGAEPELSERARAFARWIEAFRTEGPDGKPGAEPFLAHPLSQVMPFLVLLHDRYEDELIAAHAPPEALAFAFDAGLAVDPAEFCTSERFAPGREALRTALEWCAELRERTLAEAPGGFANAEYFRGLATRPAESRALFPAPWSAPLYGCQAEEWGSTAPPVALRWGQMNVYALTPHRWSFDPVLENPRQVEGWLASIFAPETMEPPLPYYRAQAPAVFPVGGTHDSLFQVHREGFLSYAASLLPRGDRFLALAPVDFGSQLLFLVELVPDARPRVRVLPALGATEITVDLPGHGARAGDLFLPTARFARGEWSTLLTEEEALRETAAPHPVPAE